MQKLCRMCKAKSFLSRYILHKYLELGFMVSILLPNSDPYMCNESTAEENIVDCTTDSKVVCFC